MENNLDSLKKEIKSFMDDKVWVTKKCRIEAEVRMNTNYLFSQVLVNYYTFIVLAFSIWSLIIKNPDTTSKISVLTVIASVGLFGITLFLSSIGYKEKAIQFRDSYLNLTTLEYELKCLLRKTNIEDILPEFQTLEKKYNEILSRNDNHHQFDFLKIQVEHKLNVTKDTVYKYYKNIVFNYFFKVILFLIPVFLIIIFFVF